MNKNQFRLGALLYDNDNPAFKRETTIRKIVESYFALTDNKSEKCSMLPTLINDMFDIGIHIDEVRSVVRQDKYFEFTKGSCNFSHPESCNAMVKLRDVRYQLIVDREQNGSIYKFINEYYFGNEKLQSEMTEEEFVILIENFLYSIYVQNMEKSSAMFDLKMEREEVLEDLDIDNNKRKIINDFLDYDDDNKNKAIFDIGSLALEFVILNGHIDLKNQEPNILKKTLYLDTNIIYRLLGINGLDRQRKVENLLRRCNETGQKLKISYASQKEFFESINRHLHKVSGISKKIKYTKPISDAIVKNFYDSNGGNIKVYEARIKAKYESLIREYKIEVDEVDFDTLAKDGQRTTIDRFSKSLAGYKRQREIEIRPDAINIAYIHKLREGQGNNFRSLKEFFLTSDKQLINWEVVTLDEYPVAMYPSNWLSIILKFGTRTSDDYKSFVSFIRNVYIEEKRDFDSVMATLSVISSYAETVEKEEDLFNIIIESEYENINKLESIDDKKEYVENQVPIYIEQLLEKQNVKIELIEGELSKTKDELSKTKDEHSKEIDKLKLRDELKRIEVIKAKYDSLKSKRKTDFLIWGSLMLLTGFIDIKYILSVMSFVTNDTGNKSITFTAKGTILDDIISLIVFPIFILSIKKVVNSISKKSLRQEMLLMEITPKEIENIRKAN
ncbi:MAG: hypothetical protein JXR88_00330 [Clostridia bacterium]|nr:hypothetical protein [Clostridia bacterium]